MMEGRRNLRKERRNGGGYVVDRLGLGNAKAELHNERKGISGRVAELFGVLDTD